MATCGRGECVYEAAESMIKKMKEDVSRKTGIPEDEIAIAKIYHTTAKILAEACRRSLKINKDSCEPSKGFRTKEISIKTFITLKELEDDGLITHDYKEKIFASLLKMKPSVKLSVEESKKTGMV